MIGNRSSGGMVFRDRLRHRVPSDLDHEIGEPRIIGRKVVNVGHEYFRCTIVVVRDDYSKDSVNLLAGRAWEPGVSTTLPVALRAINMSSAAPTSSSA